MSEEQPAQPRYVTQDQHRADKAELRGELKEDIASLRQDTMAMRGELKEEMAGVRQEIAVLTKMVEANQQTLMLRFDQVDRQLAQHETRLLNLENWMRATFVTVAIVVIGVASQLFYTLLRFGFKSPTP